MHGGNLSFFIEGEHVGEIAPVYDMLPMGLAPVNEELAPLSFTAPILIPSDRETWLSVLPVALQFWQRVKESQDIGLEIREYAEKAIEFLKGR